MQRNVSVCINQDANYFNAEVDFRLVFIGILVQQLCIVLVRILLKILTTLKLKKTMYERV